MNISKSPLRNQKVATIIEEKPMKKKLVQSKTPVKGRVSLLNHQKIQLVTGSVKRDQQYSSERKLKSRQKAKLGNVEVKQINLYDPEPQSKIFYGFERIAQQYQSAKQSNIKKIEGIKRGGYGQPQNLPSRSPSSRKSLQNSYVKTKYETSQPDIIGGGEILTLKVQNSSEGFNMNFQDTDNKPGYFQGPQFNSPTAPYPKNFIKRSGNFMIGSNKDQSDYDQNIEMSPKWNKSTDLVNKNHKPLDQTLEEDVVSEENYQNLHEQKQHANLRSMLQEPSQVVLYSHQSQSPENLNASQGSSLEDGLEESSPYGRNRHSEMKISSRSKEKIVVGIKQSLQKLNLLSPKFKSILDQNRKDINVTEFTAQRSNIFSNPMIQQLSELEQTDSIMKPVFKNLSKRVKTPNAETKFASIVTGLMQKKGPKSSLRKVIDDKFKGSFNTLLVESSCNTFTNHNSVGRRRRVHSPSTVYSDQMLEEYIQENMKQYVSILTAPGESYRYAHSEYKTLYSDRYHMKRHQNQLIKDNQNLESVNSYLEQKLADKRTQDKILSDDINSLLSLINQKRKLINFQSSKQARDLAHTENQKYTQMERVQLMQEQNQAQMQGHMSYIISQKDEIVFLRDKLFKVNKECEDMNNMHNKLSKAEEERMKEVIKATNKVT